MQGQIGFGLIFRVNQRLFEETERVAYVKFLYLKNKNTLVFIML